MMMINEKLLKESIISNLTDNFDYNQKQADEFANQYVYEIMDKMYDAETDSIEEIISRKE